MKNKNLEIGLSIAFILMIVLCRGLVSYYFEHKTLVDSLEEVTMMFGSIFIVVIGVGLVTAIAVLVYRKK